MVAFFGDRELTGKQHINIVDEIDFSNRDHPATKLLQSPSKLSSGPAAQIRLSISKVTKMLKFLLSVRHLRGHSNNT